LNLSRLKLKPKRRSSSVSKRRSIKRLRMPHAPLILQEPAVQNAIHAGDEARAAHKPLRSVWPDGMTAEQLIFQGSPACAHLPGYASNVDYELRFRLVTTMVNLAKNCPYWTLPANNKTDHRMTSKYAFEEFSSALRSSPDFKAAVSYVSIAALATLCPCILHR
jgi:hypothetical protein